MKTSWDECNSEVQLMMLAYDYIRQHEENQQMEAMMQLVGAGRLG